MDFLTDVKKVFVVWKRTFGRVKYLTIGVFTAFVFYLLNGFIVAHPRIGEFFDLYGALAFWKIFLVSLYYSYEILPQTFVGVIVLSILIGMMIGLLVYRFDHFAHVKGGGFFATIGVFLGMAAPGCAACGVGLVSLVGLGSVLSVLPYNGQEIMVVAIAASLVSVFILSKKLYNPVCEIVHETSSSHAFTQLKGGTFR